MEQDVVENYIVNKDTLALVPYFKGEAKTLIYEKGKKPILAKKTPLKILDDACIAGGASLEGRNKAVRERTNIQKKRPVPVNLDHMIYAFPVMSYLATDNEWVFIHHLIGFEHATPSKGKGKTVLTFSDQQKLTVRASKYSIKQQMQRTHSCIVEFNPKNDAS
ncbi:competence protein ComK [Thalassobacillus sp. C254]|uniref:competence protein ComK n=1 Tax=Thalassobacillus sp. C254 TaxID=1225341 RepID=UPI0006CF70C3|nr:competence protein ComK [Thalassobacillus sp. C254]